MTTYPQAKVLSRTDTRVGFVDVARGIAIWCIVLGHQGFSDINRFVFTFHVPIFFLLAGCFFNEDTSWGQYLKKKARSLLLPYFIASVALFVFDVVFHILRFGSYGLPSELCAAFGSSVARHGRTFPVPLWVFCSNQIENYTCNPESIMGDYAAKQECAMKYVKRDIGDIFKEALRTFPAVALMGPRQCGKTTLAKAEASKLRYVSLEDPDVRRAALDDPRYFLGQFKEGAVFDEIQNAPQLLSYLQGVIDDNPDAMGRFVLTGSRQFALMESMSQSLAGRIGVLTMSPFTWREWYGAALAEQDVDEVILKGLYPPPLVRRASPRLWFASYFQTYLERDVRQILKVRDLAAFELFVRILAGRTGQELNLNSLGTDSGVTHTTARAWLSVLEAAGLVFRLPPYFRNYSKRLVSAPKLYFADTGLACWLMGIETSQQLHLHPLYGAVFETAVVSELRKRILNTGGRTRLHYWRDHSKLEIDLIEETQDGPLPIEIKSGRTYRSEWASPMRRWLALTDTDPSKARIVYGGELAQRDGTIEIVPWRAL